MLTLETPFFPQNYTSEKIFFLNKVKYPYQLGHLSKSTQVNQTKSSEIVFALRMWHWRIDECSFTKYCNVIKPFDWNDTCGSRIMSLPNARLRKIPHLVANRRNSTQIKFSPNIRHSWYKNTWLYFPFNSSKGDTFQDG